MAVRSQDNSLNASIGGHKSPVAQSYICVLGGQFAKQTKIGEKSNILLRASCTFHEQIQNFQKGGAFFKSNFRQRLRLREFHIKKNRKFPRK